jgi:hypothetical protein
MTHNYCKSSYTIPKGPSKERRGEQTKIKINASQSKITFVSRWKSLTKGGKSTLAYGWRRQRTPMVSLDGVTSVLEVSACIV